MMKILISSLTFILFCSSVLAETKGFRKFILLQFLSFNSFPEQGTQTYVIIEYRRQATFSIRGVPRGFLFTISQLNTLQRYTMLSNHDPLIS